MKAIGMVEYKTVSSGIKAADLIVKTAEVELLEAQTVCPGKFIILFTGDLSAIRVSVDAAVKTYPESLIDSLSWVILMSLCTVPCTVQQRWIPSRHLV